VVSQRAFWCVVSLERCLHDFPIPECWLRRILRGIQTPSPLDA
jgi:hypothetical protein